MNGRHLLRALLVSAILCLAAGCATDIAAISSVSSDLNATTGDADTSSYGRSLAALVAEDGLGRFDRLNGIGASRAPADMPWGPAASQRRELAALAAPVETGSKPSTAHLRLGQHRFAARWRASGQILYLAPASQRSGTEPYLFSGVQSKSVDITVIAAEQQAYHLAMVCDGAMEISGPGGLVRHPARTRFDVAAGRRSAPVHLRPATDLIRCDGKAKFYQGSRALTILREEVAKPELASIENRFDVCAPGPDSGVSPLERVFYSDRWLSQTCPFDPGKVDLLADSRDAFNAKVEALLGAKLTDRFFDAGDPESPLDFSNAPDLTMIIVSYLDIKADFSGRVLDRLLRFHAKRGATIRIVTSGVLVGRKDRAMLLSLASDHHNVQLKTFVWHAPAGATFAEKLSRYHKVHHTKLLAAVSRDAGRSVAILGGRNIHDGFLFEKPVDLSAYPKLQQYKRNRGLTTNYYSNWRDLDLALHDDDAVRTLAAHFSTLWLDDTKTYVTRPFSVATTTGQASRNGIARHFISVPYSDNRALETYYVDLIDAAARSIEIVNPYLNLTPKLGLAMERAVSRGVRITIVGRIDMRGDLGGDVVTALNEEFVKRYGDRISIYDYKDTALLLHAKILLIDGRLAIVSSVNFNNRSFIHDNENGLVTLDEGIYRRLRSIFDAYRDAARPVEVRSVPLVWKLLCKSQFVREAL